jgi:uncharacterized protein YjbI with pentapeptide repeats
MSDEHAVEQAQTLAPKWGDPISDERRAALQDIMNAWNAPDADHAVRRGPFDGVRLTGADAFWLAEQSVHDELGQLANLHLEGADLSAAYLEKAVLLGAHLEGATLGLAHLEEANLTNAHLEGAELTWSYLKGATLAFAHLKGANLTRANLEDVGLLGAHLEGATLVGAHLERANLFGGFLQDTLGDFLQSIIFAESITDLVGNIFGVNLDEADLSDAHLEGANLEGAHLVRANLRGTRFDSTSRLGDAILTGASFDQVSFDNTKLIVADWSLVDILGDERIAKTRRDEANKPKVNARRLREYKAAVRANRILSVALQAQGLAEDAARFSHRAQILQRQVLRRQRKFGGYLFSLLIAALAGYGYRLRRILIAYGLVVLLFAVGYFLAGSVAGQAQAHLSLQQQLLDALQISLNAIHGRVFFTQLGLDTLQSWLATLESIAGIVIEGVFVAMLIQRFFAR